MLLTCENISINFGGRNLLEKVSFYLNEGDKVGIIGINGTGKSTFLRILSGALEPDEGRVSRDPNVQLSVLAQNPAMDENDSLLEHVFRNYPKEFRELNEYEAKAMLTKLGLPEHDRRIGTLSGGQKKRLALACALIHPADVLILDEPTNHLDAEMTLWLEERLRKFRGGLVMVTHDRYFLERVANHITELDKGKLYHYEANYSKYLEIKAERLEMAQASERKRQSILRVEKEWIQRGCRARSTKSKDRIERYEQLQAQSAPEADDNVKISAAASRLGKKLIELDKVSKSYDGKEIIQNFSYKLLREDRIGITGVNGAGKSTLLHLMAGELLPDSGTVETGSTVRIGHFSQEGKELDLNQRVYDFIHDIGDEVRTRDGTFTAKAMMERFLFPSDLQRLPVGKLSGGERRRLYLLSVLMSAPNILLLDEPTNDLDVMTLSILEDYLDSFPGPVIVVSHDRFLLDKIAEQIFEVRDGQVLRYSGNWTDWQEKRKEEQTEFRNAVSYGKSSRQNGSQAENAAKQSVTAIGAAAKTGSESPRSDSPYSESPRSNSPHSDPPRSDSPYSDPPHSGRPRSDSPYSDPPHSGRPRSERKLKFSFKEQREYETIDADIAALEDQIQQCLKQQEACCSDYVRLQELAAQQQELENALEEKEERWLYLQELKEKIDAQ